MQTLFELIQSFIRTLNECDIFWLKHFAHNFDVFLVSIKFNKFILNLMSILFECFAHNVHVVLLNMKFTKTSCKLDITSISTECK
jgi:hypothetical protein